jgi:hypothetical protein
MLTQRSRNGKMQWCLVSRSKPSKVLQWYGVKKPGEKQVEKTEKRVRFFKHEVYKKIPTKKKFD